MLDLVSPIYRYLIYQYLDLQSLSNLALVCKKLNLDPKRKDQIVQTISQSFGIRSSRRPEPIVLYNKMPNDILERLVIQYITKTVSVEISLTKKNVFYLSLYFDTQLFLALDYPQQFYMIDYYFDLHHKYSHIIHHLYDLQLIFLSGSEKTKNYLMQKMIDQPSQIFNSLFVENFLMDLIHLISFYDKIDQILEIGLYLLNHWPKYLQIFMESNFAFYEEDYETDPSYDDFAKDLEQALDRPSLSNPEFTNEKILDLLLSNCKLFTVKHLRNINQYRMSRLDLGE